MTRSMQYEEFPMPYFSRKETTYSAMDYQPQSHSLSCNYAFPINRWEA